ncbi:MAG: pentapeptide repeat-containing protein [Pseudomonadota bacterium]
MRRYVPPDRLTKTVEAIARSQKADSDLADTRDAVNDAARMVRTLSFTFLLVGLYILILGSQTTHEQLLRAAPIALPLLGVEVDIVAAYILTPLLFVILHVNLLVQYGLLNDRIDTFNAAIEDLRPEDQETECRRLFPLPYVALRARRGPQAIMAVLLGVVVWVSLVGMPAVVLLWSQIRFLPYQHDFATLWQQGLLVLDVVLVWRLRRRLRLTAEPDAPASGIVGDRYVRFWYVAVLVFGLVVAVPRPLGWVLVGWSPMPFIVRIPAPAGSVLDAWSDRGFRPLGQVLSGEGEPFARDDFAWWPSWLPGIERRLVVRNRILMAREPSGDVYTRFRDEACAAAASDEAGPAGHDVVCDSTVSDAGDRAAQRDPDHAEPLNLTDRNFRFANLEGSVLPRALLDGADVRNARLFHTELPDATMVETQLQGADLRRAQLQGADLRDTGWWQATRSADTDLAWADLTGADDDVIPDLDAWIAEQIARIDDAETKDEVRQRLRTTLGRDDDPRPSPPAGLLDAAGNLVRGDDAPAYWRSRADVLARFACAADLPVEGTIGVARTLFRYGDDAPPTARLLLAKRLLDPACGPAKGVSAAVLGQWEDERDWLRTELAEAVVAHP